jgi:four helix bundle protein
LLVYKNTKYFPVDEKFALIDQIRRCVISISSNIAEGFGRNSAKDKLQFYAISRGSLLELESQLLIAKDLRYLKPQDFNILDLQIVRVSKLIGGLMKSAPARF